jgi:hypothetical protein
MTGSDDQEISVDVQEIRKLENYMKRLFDNPQLRVVPRSKQGDQAEVLVGEDSFGRILLDDEDEGRSYNFQKSLTLPDRKRLTKLDNETVAKLNGFVKTQMGERWSVRKRPTKTDSADLHLGDEFIGVVFAEEGGFAIEMAILEEDLE